VAYAARSGHERSPGSCRFFSDAYWDHADLNTESGPLSENTSTVFRTHVNLSIEDLAADKIMLRFGMIDDDGWVYVNGQFVGESHDWQASPAFDLRKFLHAGDNSIAVAVHNGDGPGGINKSVSLAIPNKPITVQWKRHVFNGFAQVIVQSEMEPGEIWLTANAGGLAGNTVVIEARGHSPRPQAAPYSVK
jgi:hypothetical protein